MAFSKKDIERARNEYWLKEARKQTGKNIQSLDEVTYAKKTKKKPLSLGKALLKKSKRKF